MKYYFSIYQNPEYVSDSRLAMAISDGVLSTVRE